MRAGFFHQLQDLRNGGLAEFLRRPDPQDAGHIDAAADDLIARRARPRGTALAGQRRWCSALEAPSSTMPSSGTFSPGLHHDDIADRDLLRVHLCQLAALHFHIRVVRADIHQLRDRLPAALADRVALEQLADLVKQHDGNGLA